MLPAEHADHAEGLSKFLRRLRGLRAVSWLEESHEVQVAEPGCCSERAERALVSRRAPSAARHEQRRSTERT